jgi:hypothetical protein
LDAAEAESRIRAAPTLQELFAAYEAAPDEDDGYDLLKALDENRKGERPLFPPEETKRLLQVRAKKEK